MRSNLMFVATALAFSVTCPADETLRAKVHAADLEQFHALIKDADNQPFDARYLRELIDHAITSQRLDLLADLFSNPNTSIDFRRKAGQLPSSDFTDKIAIVMLRSPMATFWPYEGPPRNGSRVIEMAGPEPLMIQPLTTAFEKLLPGITRDTLKKMIWTEAGRSQLADQLYAAMEAKGVQFTDEEKKILLGSSPSASVVSPSGTSTPLTKPQLSVSSSVPKAILAPESVTTTPDSKSECNRNWAFWGPLGAVLALGLAALLLKMR